MEVSNETLNIDQNYQHAIREKMIQKDFLESSSANFAVNLQPVLKALNLQINIQCQQSSGKTTI